MRLASECRRKGHEAAILAINDQAVAIPQEEQRMDEAVVVKVLRLPATLDWQKRWAWLSDWPESQDCDVISLQFVCFGFHPKGLTPWNFGRNLRRLAGSRPIHIMFHETWLGCLKRDSIGYRLWGAAQRMLIQRMLREIKPAIMHTHARPYQWLLAQMGWASERLSLISNIPIRSDGPDWAGVSKELTRATGKVWERSDIWLIGIFGTLHPQWRAEALIEAFAPFAARTGKQVFFVLLGRHGRQENELAHWRSITPPGIKWLNIGELEACKLSGILKTLDFGTVSTPLAMMDKSGAAAAFDEHGIPLVITRDDCHFRGHFTEAPRSSARYHFADGELSAWLAVTSKTVPESKLPAVAEQFLNSLKRL
jgi:hypothetical protein